MLLHGVQDSTLHETANPLCTVSSKLFLAGTLDFVCAYQDFYCVPFLYWTINVVSVGEGRLLLLLAVVVTMRGCWKVGPVARI